MEIKLNKTVKGKLTNKFQGKLTKEIVVAGTLRNIRGSLQKKPEVSFDGS